MIELNNSLIEELLAEEAKSQERFVKWLKVPPREGDKVAIRLFPANADTVVKHYQHWQVAERPITCLKTFNEECPICQDIKNKINKIYSDSNLSPTQKKEFAKKFYNRQAKESICWFCFVVENGNVKTDSVYIYRAGKTLLDDIKAHRELGQDALDPVNGVIIYLIRSENNRIRKVFSSPLNIINALEEVKDKVEPIVNYIPRPKEEHINSALEKINELYTSLGFKNEDVSEPDITQSPVNAQLQKCKMLVGDIEYELTKDEKKKVIQSLIGINIPDEHCCCFGYYNEKDGKCLECEDSVICSEFSDFIKNDKESVKIIVDSILNK
jgi:hypothetical protein